MLQWKANRGLRKEAGGRDLRAVGRLPQRVYDLPLPSTIRCDALVRVKQGSPKRPELRAQRKPMPLPSAPRGSRAAAEQRLA